MSTSRVSVIGTSTIRRDAAEKVTGQATLAADLGDANLAHLKALFSEEPHAAIRFVDVDQTRQADGVLAILTARDVPVNEYGLETPDQPVLCGPGSEKPFALDRITQRHLE